MARKADIDTIDTAALYGNSEATLGSIGVDDFRIVTKLPGVPEGIADIAEWARISISQSLARLGVERIGGLLLHRPADLLGTGGNDLKTGLVAARSEGLVESIGYSIYNPEDLHVLFPVLEPDLVQVPYNVFDRRIETSGWLARLMDSGARVHIRSAFLQGLLMMPRGSWPDQFRPWRSLLDRWWVWCDESGFSPVCVALQHALHLAGVERVVVGVESVSQLRELIGMLECEAPEVPAEFRCHDEKLIDPSMWGMR